MLAHAEAKIQRVKDTLWLGGFDRIPCGTTFAIILVIGIILRSLGCFEGETLRLILALGVVNTLIIVGTVSFTPYLPRYVLPSCVINAGALAVLLGRLDDLFPGLLSQKRST